MIVRMYRLTDSENDTDPPGTWEVQMPNGAILDTTGSTSQGLQEAINYAAEKGYDLEVYGGGIASDSGQDVAIIMITETLDIPALQGVNWKIHATLNFCGPDPRTTAVHLDSIMNSTIKWTGQIVCAAGWGVGVKFHPFRELPQDPNGPCITASKISLPSVIMISGGKCIEFDAFDGAITGNIFELLEPNGGNIGIKVTPGANKCFDHNFILAREVHGAISGIVAGDLENGAQIFGNSWNVAVMPLSVGVEIFGRNEHWVISVDNREGQPATGITLNPGAAHNIIDVLRNDATTKINDASGNSLNAIRMP